MGEDWNTNPHEHLLDSLYEGLAAYQNEFVPDIYGVTPYRPVAVLYVEDSEGNCWEITAKRHSHETRGYHG